MTRDLLWTDKTAGKATGGEATETFEAEGVAFDSRQIESSDLFVALKGDETDGHRFVSQAFAKGAAAAMVDHKPEDVADQSPLLVVVDTSNGLEDLARAARARTKAKIAAVTGSVGKTGTKEALNHVLSAQAETHVSEKSFNNHVGTPLSLARMRPETQFGVFEVGTNAPGEIARLAELVRPHVALITTVEAVHVANFSGEDAIADEKAAVFAALEDGGIAVINGDNRHAATLMKHAQASPAGRIVRFGTSDECEHRLIERVATSQGSRITASIDGQAVTYILALPGHHQALNSVAVLAVAHHLGADVSEAAASLETLPALAGRGERHTVAVSGGQAVVIDESYNASPVAVRAALDVLGETETETVATGRRIAVLGDMLELGDDATSAHTGLSGDLIRNKVDLLFAVGPLMNRLYGELPPARRGGAAGDAGAIAMLLRDVVRPGDVILVKGSRRIGLEAVVAALTTTKAARRAAARG